MNSIYSLNKYSVVPNGAQSIGVFDSNGNLKKTFSIGELKKQSGEIKYRFGVLADTHQNTNQQTENENQTDLRNALSVLSEKEGVDFICIAGDITNDGCNTVQQISSFANAISASNVAPTYAVAGNHDCTNNGFNNLSFDNWKKNTIDFIKGSYKGVDTPTITYSDSKLAFYFKKNIPGTENSDFFIFLGMNIWNFSGNIFLDSDINFVSNILKGEAADARCFIFLHPFFKNKAGDLHDLYYRNNILGGNQGQKLMNLYQTHPNTLWFSGHSHWKQYLSFQPPLEASYAGIYSNVYRDENRLSCGWTVHVASCAYPRDAHYDENQHKWVSDAEQDWTSKASEGMVVDVYDDKVVIRGISFKDAWGDGTGDQGYITRYQPCGTYGLSAQSGSPIPIPDGSYTTIKFVDGTSYKILHKQDQISFDIGLLELEGITDGWTYKPREIEFGNIVQNIGDYVCQQCYNLTSISIPHGVITIQYGAFAYTGLTTVEIPESIVYICGSAFSYCDNLEEVQLRCGIHSIEGNVFYNCTNLRTVYAPNIYIQELIEHECLGLGVDDYGTHTVVVYCADGPFVVNGGEDSSGSESGSEDVSEDFTFVEYYDGNTWSGLIDGELSYVSIPNISWAKNIVIGNLVTSIYYDTFYGCYELREITLPYNINPDSIDNNAFYNCPNLNVVNAPGMYTYDFENYNYAYHWGLGVDDYGTHTVVVYCADGPFVVNGGEDSSGSESGSEDESLTYVEYYGGGSWSEYLDGYVYGWTDIYDLSNAVKIKLGDEIAFISQFDNSPNLTEITLPESLGALGIDNNAFYNCPNLTAVNAPGMYTYDFENYNYAGDWGLGVDDYGTHTVVVYCADGPFVVN